MLLFYEKGQMETLGLAEHNVVCTMPGIYTFSQLVCLCSLVYKTDGQLSLYIYCYKVIHISKYHMTLF